MAEVTLICMDTSSWMQDNKSSRFLAQADAIELYCKTKIDCHPENCVSIMAMGNRVNILVQPTRDLEKIMSSIQGARVDNDSMHFLDALESADRFFENKMLDRRLVVFAGGPIFWYKYHTKEFAMKLKLKCVAVDVVNFGDKLGPQVGVRFGPWDPSWNDSDIKGESKKENLEALVATANNFDNSRILHVPEDENSLRDHLARSPILPQRELEGCSNSLESIIARLKAQNFALLQENVETKRELEFFNTEFNTFVRQVKGRGRGGALGQARPNFVQGGSIFGQASHSLFR